MTAPLVTDALVRAAAQAIAEAFNEGAGALATGDPEGSGSVAGDWLSEARAALEAVAADLQAQAVRDAVGSVCHGDEQHADHVRYCVPLLGRANAIEAGHIR